MRTEPFVFRVSRWLLVGLIGVLAVSLVACDSGGDNGDGEEEEEESEFPDPPGRPGFTSTATGAWSMTRSGSAVHGIDRIDEIDAYQFAVRLDDTAAREGGPAILLLSERATPPGRGTYAVAAHSRDDAFSARVALPEHADLQPATSGTLEITDRTDTTLEGQFRLEVEDVEGHPVTVTGSFHSTSDR